MSLVCDLRRKAKEQQYIHPIWIKTRKEVIREKLLYCY